MGYDLNPDQWRYDHPSIWVTSSNPTFDHSTLQDTPLGLCPEQISSTSEFPLEIEMPTLAAAAMQQEK